ncbi:hypothetical protein GRI40_06345 [Altererythrobacter aerius]|uniref:Uncharacterized protein n=1 Tax=Tsuneonella aeria TaxID=1837929 RepID=A0A6I4TBE2_9SPHN|nr:hypothetical protein [Tsuneonella aeria]MXO74839.1 hypothetical protein [Tsuneonella aeria]
MLTMYDDATLEVALKAVPASAIRDTLMRVVHDAKACDLWSLTCVLVIETGDDGAELRETLGFDPLTGPLHEPGTTFEPYWSRLERHSDHYEMLITAGNEGFAYFVLVPDNTGAALARFLAAHRPSADGS